MCACRKHTDRLCRVVGSDPLRSLTIIDVSCYSPGMDTMLPVGAQTAHTSETDFSHADACCSSEIVVTPSLDATQTSKLADRLKALADPTRLRMLDLLAHHAEPLCVCDITRQFDLHQPTISHHLRILREARLIAGERHGVWSYYAATDAGKQCLSLVRDLV